MSILARALPFLLLLSGCAIHERTAFAPTPVETRLVDLMSKRLAIAHEVAWIKYSSQLPVRDAKREAEVLDRLSLLATQNNLDAVTARNFFTAQIHASRLQQENDIRLWKAGATLPARPPQSLRDDIRPKIDLLDRALITVLAQLGSPRSGLSAFAHEEFRHEGFSRTSSQVASDALR